VGTDSAATEKSAGALAEKNGDRVLELRALDSGVDGLGLGGLELRFGLSDIGHARQRRPHTGCASTAATADKPPRCR